MKINKFEDIQAWQESRILTRKIYELSESNKSFSKDLRFKSQITSCAVSVMSNIAEGFSRGGNKEFARFLFISKGSLSELQSQLYIALDLKYITKKDFDEVFQLSDKTARLISKFISYLKNTINAKI
ncbi:MAG: four helix bundle protein [Candidatus Omnitrophica bacterium]|nr:four helix bundle protein [Candidatus Omnitrophota bacterium]